MAKTVKEKIESAKEYFVNDGLIETTTSIQIINTLNNILQAYEKEIAEKNKEIELMNEQCDGAIKKLQQTQLYKEDFKLYCPVCTCSYTLKDNSKYNKLPSKDDK